MRTILLVSVFCFALFTFVIPVKAATLWMPTDSEPIKVYFTNTTGDSLAIFDDDDATYTTPLVLGAPSDTVSFSQTNGDWDLSSTETSNTLTLSDSFNFVIGLYDASGWIGNTDYEKIAFGVYNLKWGNISGVTVMNAQPVSDAQAIMTNGTETTYIPSDEKLTFVWDEDSDYDLSFSKPIVKAYPIVDDTLYEFIIPNFYDPLPMKTIEITMIGAGNAGGLELARVLDVFGADTPFGVSGPAVPVEGGFVSGTITSDLVTELWEIYPNPDFEYVRIFVPDSFNLVSILIVTQSVPGPNQPPEANCQNVTVSTEAGLCSADASVDDGSVDPDGDPITLVQEPPEPYELGDTVVTLTVTDDSGENDSCTATVTVIDDIAPVAECNAAPTIVPPDAPISFIATAEDNCVVSSVVITEYDCSFINGAGKLVDKKESCVVEFSGDTITIQDSGGVGDHITWTILATDDSGNTTEVECAVDVVNPGKGK